MEIPIYTEDYTYLTKSELSNMKLSIKLTKMIIAWTSCIQNSFNWHNPKDDNIFLPDYYIEFIKRLENDIIIGLKDYNVELINR